MAWWRIGTFWCPLLLEQVEEVLGLAVDLLLDLDSLARRVDFHFLDHLSRVAGEDWAGSAGVPVQPFVAPCDPPLVLPCGCASVNKLIIEIYKPRLKEVGILYMHTQ